MTDAEAIASRLTPAQMRALLWLASEQHHKSAWTVNGKPVRKHPPEQWTHLRVQGDGGSIVIHKDDMRAIRDLIVGVGTSERIWGLSETGLAVRAVLLAEDAPDD